MSTVFDTLEKDIIAGKLAGGSHAASAEGTNAVMLDSLAAMNRTSVNTSYRPIASAGVRGKFIKLFKRLIRRLTFWYVEPCMMQQSQYNAANDRFSAEVNSEMNQLRLRAADSEKLRDAVASLMSETALMHEKLASHEQMLAKLEKLTLSPEESHESNISFSQAGEDSIIRYLFRELGIQPENCRYLDIGANHALHLSNTYSFFRQGASGVLVEADPVLAEELRTVRERDIVINKCISSSSGEKVKFYIMSGDGLSTADRAAAEAASETSPDMKISREIEAETISLMDIAREYFPDKAPDIMDIDIEGTELEVLRSTDFEKFRPAVIICEMISYRKGLTVGEKNSEILSFMKSAGYEEFAFTGINSVFIDSRRTKEV